MPSATSGGRGRSGSRVHDDRPGLGDPAEHVVDERARPALRRGRPTPRLITTLPLAAPLKTALKMNASAERDDDPDQTSPTGRETAPEILAADQPRRCRMAAHQSRSAWPVRCRNTTSRSGSITSTDSIGHAVTA